MTDHTTSDDTSVESTDPYCVNEHDATALLRGAPWRRLAVMGDSFAAGTGGPRPGYADVPWPERIARALRGVHPDLAYLNTGVVGQRTAQVRETQLEQVLAFRPDLVNVAAGGNDLFSANPRLDQVEAELDAVYGALTGIGAHVFAFTVADVFESFPELASFRETVDDLNGRIRKVAAAHGATLVDMWDHPIRRSPTLLSADGIHFSMEGQAVLAGEILRALATTLRSGAAQQPAGGAG